MIEILEHIGLDKESHLSENGVGVYGSRERHPSRRFQRQLSNSGPAAVKVLTSDALSSRESLTKNFNEGKQMTTGWQHHCWCTFKRKALLLKMCIVKV